MTEESGSRGGGTKKPRRRRPQRKGKLTSSDLLPSTYDANDMLHAYTVLAQHTPSTKISRHDTEQFIKASRQSGNPDKFISDYVSKGPFNVASQTTIKAKPGKNRAGGTGFKQEPPTTIKSKKDSTKEVDRDRAGIPDPYANYPTMGDVQSESLGILDDLVQGMLFDSGGDSYDYESAMQNIAQGIKQAYKADIQAIRGNIKAARKDTKRGRREIEGLYAGLAKAYGKDARQADATMDASVAQVQDIANQSTENLQNTHSEISNEEAALLKSLGVQAAAPDIIDNEQATASIARIADGSANAATLQQQMGQANVDFMNRGRAGARMEGADRSADLLNQFLGYKRGARDEIAGLKGDRAREITESNASVQSQAAEMQAAADAETWTRLMDYLGMRSDIEQQGFDNQMDAGQFQWGQQMDLEGLANDRRRINNDMRFDQKNFMLDKYDARTRRINALEPPASSPREQEQLLPDEFANPLKIIEQSPLPLKEKREVVAVLEGLRRSPQFQFDTATGPNGTEYKLTPEKAAQMATMAARQAGLSQRQIELIRLAAYSST